MNALIRFFLENHKLTIILSLSMIIFGVMGLLRLKAESFPNVNFASVLIETRYEGATAEDVETKITRPIEDKIREVSGLKDVRSTSKSGFSSIFVRVDMDNENEEEVLDELQKAVDGVSDLPLDLAEEPRYMEINSEEFPAIEVAVTGPNDKRQRDIMVDHLKEELEDNKMIKDVRLVGFTKRQFNIRLDEQKMLEHHIGIEEVLKKVRERNVNIPGGEIKTEGNKKLVRIEAKVADINELQNLVVRSNFTGRKILLKDIATVIDDREDAKVLANYNGVPATFLVVNKKGRADTIALVEKVDAIIERFKDSYKNEFKIFVYNNEAEKVKNRLEILNSNAISGLILVIIFLFLFLPGRIGIVAALSLPLAVMATIGYMPVLGMNLDAITILALVIALGMMVDNAVVISENFARIKNDEGLDSKEAAFKSVSQLWLPITATAFTTIAAFLPMLVTKGIMGEFIKFIPIVVTIALLVCLGEGFFLLPMRLRLVEKASTDLEMKDRRKEDWFHVFIRKFENFMHLCVSNRYKVMGVFSFIIVGSLLLMGKGNKFILFPAEQVEIYIGRLEMPRGTTIEKTEEELEHIANKLRTKLGKWQRSITARAGISKMGPFDPKGGTGDNLGLLLIYASSEAKYNVNYLDFLAEMRKVTSEAAQDLVFNAQINGPPVGEPINATFRSNNDENMNKMMDEIITELSTVPGIRDLKIDDILGEREVKVKIDYVKADQLGISAQAIGNAIRTALSGTMVSKITLDNKEIDINVRYNDDYRKQLEDIADVNVMDMRGNLVPVKNVAEVILTDGSNEIKRFDFKRSKTLTGEVDEMIITSKVANDKLSEIFTKLNAKYRDVSLVFGGQEESTNESLQSLFQALVMSLLGIFGLLVFLFKSYLRPLIIMSTIPLGLLGLSISFYLHDKPISFFAMIGVIGLGGIIVNSGIVLISFIDQLKDEGKLSMEEILVKASGMRLRAVLVTSLTTISGLIPTAYGIGGSDAMLIPMTMAMAWGLTSGTILTLIWVPCAYAILDDIHNLIFSKEPTYEQVDVATVAEKV